MKIGIGGPTGITVVTDKGTCVVVSEWSDGKLSFETTHNKKERRYWLKDGRIVLQGRRKAK